MKPVIYFRLMTCGQRAARGIPGLWRWWSTTLKRTSRYSAGLLVTFLLAPVLTFGQTGPQPGATAPLSPTEHTLIINNCNVMEKLYAEI